MPQSILIVCDNITESNAASFSYDARGNITAIDGRTFVYNQNNRLIRAEEGLDFLGEYTYNGLGHRHVKEYDIFVVSFYYVLGEGSERQ